MKFLNFKLIFNFLNVLIIRSQKLQKIFRHINYIHSDFFLYILEIRFTIIFDIHQKIFFIILMRIYFILIQHKFFTFLFFFVKYFFMYIYVCVYICTEKTLNSFLPKKNFVKKIFFLFFFI